ncbi:hypothetical protein BCEP4_2310013 [Burkholderia cepacia]|nr:hypothetical protein BCEP4_2310013 [Burkholderia cepacia]
MLVFLILQNRQRLRKQILNITSICTYLIIFEMKFPTSSVPNPLPESPSSRFGSRNSLRSWPTIQWGSRPRPDQVSPVDLFQYFGAERLFEANFALWHLNNSP